MAEKLKHPKFDSSAPSGRLHPFVGLCVPGSKQQSERIHALMQREGLSRAQLAMKAGVNPQVLWGVCTGRQTLALSSMKKMAAAYGGSYMEWHDDWKRGVLESKANALHELPPPCSSECNQDAHGG